MRRVSAGVVMSTTSIVQAKELCILKKVPSEKMIVQPNVLKLLAGGIARLAHYSHPHIPCYVMFSSASKTSGACAMDRYTWTA
jgi:hypothetical protein